MPYMKESMLVRFLFVTIFVQSFLLSVFQKLGSVLVRVCAKVGGNVMVALGW